MKFYFILLDYTVTYYLNIFLIFTEKYILIIFNYSNLKIVFSFFFFLFSQTKHIIIFFYFFYKILN